MNTTTQVEFDQLQAEELASIAALTTEELILVAGGEVITNSI